METVTLTINDNEAPRSKLRGISKREIPIRFLIQRRAEFEDKSSNELPSPKALIRTLPVL